jgi:hypothetical protein
VTPTPTLTFTCTICGEPSTDICIFCTKDSCGNHLCDKCRRCSDCCECEVHLDEHPEAANLPPQAAHREPASAAGPVTEPLASGNTALGEPAVSPGPADDPPGTPEPRPVDS